MNWGHRLLIVLAGIALLISTLVYKCMHQNFQLVSTNYYDEELKYQDKIDGMHNAAIAGNIVLQQTDKSIKLQLPEALRNNKLTGQVYFYCPANALKDVKLGLQVNDGDMLIDKSKLVASNYTIKLSLQSNSKPYYYEQPITIIH